MPLRLHKSNGKSKSESTRCKPSIFMACGLVCVLAWTLLVLLYFRRGPPSDFEHDRAALLTDAHGQKLQLKLESAERRIQELEQQIRRSANDADANLSCKQPPSSSPPKSIFQQPFTSNNPICQAFPHPIPTASSLWTAQLSQIHKASQIPNDHRFYFTDFTAQLLHLISPRLPLSVKTTLRDTYWNKVDQILRAAHARYDYLQHPDFYRERDLPIPPPIRIVIMGGSLLVGMNCRKIIRDLGFQLRLPLQDCSWANRLEKVINQYFLQRIMPGVREKQLDLSIVQVTKIAMGGTNTETGTTILEYDLIPPEAKNPDIIINAYATNDLHVLTIIEAQSGNATLRDKVFDMVQNFVRQAMESTNPCSSPPLLFHLDDYLGNEQRELWATTELSQGVQVLANYYGFASASYSDMVRDWVYGDTHEFWFSPEGWYESSASNEMLREIHPNMGMHIVAAWVMAYNMLNVVTEYCSLEGFNLHNTGMSEERMSYNSTKLNNLPELNGKRWPKGKPKTAPNGLPPPMTKSLSLENVSNLWKKDALRHHLNSQSCFSPQDDEAVKCPFSWLSGISSLLEKPSMVEAYFQEHTNFVAGDWKFLDDHGKLGIVPQSKNSQLTLEFNSVGQAIRKITIFFMKSYGTKWEGSKVQIQCYQRRSAVEEWQLLEQRYITGSHAKHTSETYTEHFDLQEAPVEAGSSLRLRMELADGETFKIMGIAICSMENLS